jgi:hypothetical protein
MNRENGQVFFNGLCPACGKGRAYVERTENPIQTAKCYVCGVRWKILRVNLYFEDALNTAAELDKDAQEVKNKYSFLLKDR